MRGLAFRRFQERKKKQWVSKTFRNYWFDGINPARIGLRAHSPAICSCPSCGNPRRHFSQRTIQELKVIDAQVMEMADITDSNSVR